MEDVEFDRIYKKYFAKMTKVEMANLIIALIYTNDIIDYEGFLKDVYQTTIEEREEII